MKLFSIILTFLLPLFGGTGFAQTGMTVFGDCYVSETASIGFFGSELTLRGDVGGEGSLVMAGKDIQTIAAHDKTISRLVIQNPTVVRVKGKLIIRKSLAVEQGTLDVLPLAKLLIEQTATVAIAAGCKLIQAGNVWQRGTDEAPPTKPHMGGSDALLLTKIPADAGFDFKSHALRSLPAHGSYQAPALQAIVTPPWWA
ncbi:hypothetical protein ACO2Q8_26750 [Larkinella sp. VNQ87]|uniref:hypothetical protein n=1 Tax=Larkinella sp. VNQ87 TaxID=3400921 RepID=UPI003C0671AD